MHEESVLVAVESALRSRASCFCGRDLDLVSRDEALWLACPVFDQPSRLPAPVASLIRELLHERSVVIRVPASVAAGATIRSLPTCA
jgi:hypothetical protein